MFARPLSAPADQSSGMLFFICLDDMKNWKPSAPTLLLLPAIIVLAAVVIVPLALSL